LLIISVVEIWEGRESVNDYDSEWGNQGWLFILICALFGLVVCDWENGGQLIWSLNVGCLWG